MRGDQILWAKGELPHCRARRGGAPDPASNFRLGSRQARVYTRGGFAPELLGGGPWARTSTSAPGLRPRRGRILGRARTQAIVVGRLCIRQRTTSRSWLPQTPSSRALPAPTCRLGSNRCSLRLSLCCSGPRKSTLESNFPWQRVLGL